MTINDIDIKNAYIAVASKDLSQVTAKNVRISDSEIGLTVYQKKSEFGPATMAVEALEMTGVEVPYLVEVHSRLIVNKEELSTFRPSRTIQH